jgi:hypothetical protein
LQGDNKMSVTRFTLIVAACAALVMFSAGVGKAQPPKQKGKPTIEKWADDPAPPDRDDRLGPPDDGDRNGPPPDRKRRAGPRGEPQQGPPDDEDRGGPPPGGPRDGDRNGPRPDGPGMGPGGPGMGPGQGGPGMGRGGQGRGPGGPGMGPGGEAVGGLGMGRGSRDLHLEYLEKYDPEMYKLVKADMDLERQTRELAMQYRRAPSDQRAKLKEKIKEVVGKHFDARQERRTLELKRLEAELQRLRESVERRQKAREKLIDDRVSDLVGHEEESGF